MSEFSDDRNGLEDGSSTPPLEARPRTLDEILWARCDAIARALLIQDRYGMLASYSDDVPDAERRNCTDPAGLAQLRATGEYLARMRGTQRGAFVLNGNHVAAKPGDWPPDTDPGRNSRSSRGML